MTASAHSDITPLCLFCSKPIVGERALHPLVKFCSDKCSSNKQNEKRNTVNKRNRELQEKRLKRRAESVPLPATEVLSVSRLPSGGTYVRLAAASALGTAYPIPNLYGRPHGSCRRVS